MEEMRLRLPSELLRALRDLSELTGRPVDVLVQAALEVYVAQRRRGLPRSIGAGANGTLQAEEIEDWLEANWHPS